MQQHGYTVMHRVNDSFDCEVFSTTNDSNHVP